MTVFPRRQYSMKALRLHQSAGLRIDDVPDLPQPEGDDVLIRVKATAITKGELEWSETTSRKSPIPGHDVTGIIEVRRLIRPFCRPHANPPRPLATKSQASPRETKSSL